MNVQDLVNDALNGKIVLPDFQRSFIWEPEDVRELLVSVLGDYFIGSILLLEQLKDESFFALRLIEGLEKINAKAEIQSIVKVLLDGQQRTSALFYALHEPDLPLKNRKSPYRFYIDLTKALDKKWDDSVIAVSLNDKKKLNEINENKNIIPFSIVKDIGKLALRFKEDVRFEDIINLANDFMKREIHSISLKSGTDPERIVETFERINRTGEPLSIFELLTAKLYKHKIKLRDLFSEAKTKYLFVKVIPPEFILKVIALVRGEETKRKNLLELKPRNFEQDWKRACGALKASFERITDIKNGYGVLEFKKWMPYSTMIVPLAGMIDFLKVNKLENPSNYKKIDCWYWASVFSTRYDEAADTKSHDDYQDLLEWFSDEKEIPEALQKFILASIDLEIDRQSSAIYRGVMGMVVLKGAFDFKTGKPPQFDKEKIQDDHMFPKKLYKYNSIPNRTLISTNLEKWKTEPSKYFKERLQEHGKDTFKLIMESHLIPKEAIKYLLKDDLTNFTEKRKQAIIYELKKRVGL